MSVEDGAAPRQDRGDADATAGPAATWNGDDERSDQAPPPGWVFDSVVPDPSRAPLYAGTEEVCNGRDDDGDGLVDEDAIDATAWYTDADGDVFAGTAVYACTRPAGTSLFPTDCDDTDASVHPGATEVWYDGVDGDCAGDSDYDQDVDEWKVFDDCDDTDASIHPGAADAWYDGVDSDCAGNSDYDKDGDGHDHMDYGGDDCDDEDATVTTYTGYADADGDGHGDAATSVIACSQPSGYVTTAGDCDDTDETVQTWFVDEDMDGYGDADFVCGESDVGLQVSAVGGDCDDLAHWMNPGMSERCYNGIDEDCDGDVDEDCVETRCNDGIDEDDDGLVDCEDGDCDAVCAETCDNGVDDDGDGLTDCDDDDCWGLLCHEAVLVSAGGSGWWEREYEVISETRRSSGYRGSGLGRGSAIDLRTNVWDHGVSMTGEVRVLPVGASTWTTCDWAATEWWAAHFYEHYTGFDCFGSCTWLTSWTRMGAPLVLHGVTVEPGCALAGSSFVPRYAYDASRILYREPGSLPHSTTAGPSVSWLEVDSASSSTARSEAWSTYAYRTTSPVGGGPSEYWSWGEFAAYPLEFPSAPGAGVDIAIRFGSGSGTASWWAMH